MTGQTIFPTFLSRDADAAIRWLVAAFGFAADQVHRAPDGGVAHAELTLGGGRVMLGQARDEGYGAIAPPPGSGATYVVVDDPDAHHARAVAAGATVESAPADRDYGSREYTARDLDGNLWTFGTYRPGAAP